jgi:hypothetical protein
MRWVTVMNHAQKQALGILISTATPTSRLTGINLATLKTLAKLGLVEFNESVLADPNKHAGPNEPARVTPVGFRAWADIVEYSRRPK